MNLFKPIYNLFKFHWSELLKKTSTGLFEHVISLYTKIKLKIMQKMNVIFLFFLPVIETLAIFSNSFVLAIFVLVLIKISYLMLFYNQLYYAYNITLLMLLTTIIFKFNLYEKFNKTFSKVLFYGRVFPQKMSECKDVTYIELIKGNMMILT